MGDEPSLEFDADRAAVRDAVATFCADRCRAEYVRENGGRFDPTRWRELAELGVLGLGSPEGEGGARELAAACEALGAAVFPGPVVESFTAAALLPSPQLERLVAGDAIAGIGAPPLFSFAPDATWLLALGPDGIRPAERVGPVEAVTTLAGEVWGRVEVDLSEPHRDSTLALANGRCAGASYLVGAASALTLAAVEHARTRRQFGRPVGEFQGVAHPLVTAWTNLEAAGLLVREAAAELDAPGGDGPVLAGAAWLSARSAALAAAAQAHQTFGAIGITLEGPAFAATRRIRQLCSLPLAQRALGDLEGHTRQRGAGLRRTPR